MCPIPNDVTLNIQGTGEEGVTLSEAFLEVQDLFITGTGASTGIDISVFNITFDRGVFVGGGSDTGVRASGNFVVTSSSGECYSNFTGTSDSVDIEFGFNTFYLDGCDLNLQGAAGAQTFTTRSFSSFSSSSTLSATSLASRGAINLYHNGNVNVLEGASANFINFQNDGFNTLCGDYIARDDIDILSATTLVCDGAEQVFSSRNIRMGGAINGGTSTNINIQADSRLVLSGNVSLLVALVPSFLIRVI